MARNLGATGINPPRVMNIKRAGGLDFGTDSVQRAEVQQQSKYPVSPAGAQRHRTQPNVNQ
jgi:hypothetical protein